MLTIVIVGIVVFVAYLVSLRLHPYRKCRWCAGSGRHFGSLFKYAQRPCRHCGGAGRRLRYGRSATGGTSG
jgi:DnaJ-class molecular chaperone